MEKSVYNELLNILKDELVPATGCTEPIAVAYAAALARDTLGDMPQKVEVAVSGNILKNVKSVVVPNTGGLRGVKSAAAAGIVAGNAELKLDVLLNAAGNEQAITDYLAATDISVVKSSSQCIFDIRVSVFNGDRSASVRIAKHHTNIVHIAKDGKDILNKDFDEAEPKTPESAALTVRNIVEFINTVNISDISELIERQISNNLAIADEGLKNDYGAKIGKTLLRSFGNSVSVRAKATAAAGSDARMNGCELPVVIVSGSGNQGLTASVPVVIYAKELGVPHDKMLRAVALSDLITVRLKVRIGKLSAYCGAVSAGCGAGAGVCYLMGGGYDAIAHTVINALAINSGVICDGAKSSCAAKIASSVDAGLLGYEMYRNGSCFSGDDGILDNNVETTINNVGDIARLGMHETDEQIIELMLGKK